jgi:hypothetical protein
LTFYVKGFRIYITMELGEYTFNGITHFVMVNVVDSIVLASFDLGPSLRDHQNEPTQFAKCIRVCVSKNSFSGCASTPFCYSFWKFTPPPLPVNVNKLCYTNQSQLIPTGLLFSDISDERWNKFVRSVQWQTNTFFFVWLEWITQRMGMLKVCESNHKRIHKKKIYGNRSVQRYSISFKATKTNVRSLAMSKWNLAEVTAFSCSKSKNLYPQVDTNFVYGFMCWY